MPTPVAYFQRSNGTLAPIYSTALARRVQSHPQFAGWHV